MHRSPSCHDLRVSGIFTSVDELAAQIPDGATVAIPADYSGCAMAAVRSLIRRGARDLHLVTVPQAGFQADMLIGAGCVSIVETSAVTLGEYGQAPRFREAVSSGSIAIRDATCPGDPRGAAGGREGHPVHPPARDPRLGRPGPPRRLARDRQPVRRRRSDRAGAGDQARRRAVPRGRGRSQRQRVDRRAAGADGDGARGAQDVRHRRARSATTICSPTTGRRRGRSPRCT